MFAPKNGMSLGPRMQGEAALAAQVQRAALFSTFAKATGMEKRLVRAVTPVMSVTRLVCPGHGQFSYKGHSMASKTAVWRFRLTSRGAPPRAGSTSSATPGRTTEQILGFGVSCTSAVLWWSFS
jgi:hypothetical protein